MQVSIHPDFAETLLELYRDAVESADISPTPAQEAQYGAFRESVAKANQRLAAKKRAKQKPRVGMQQVRDFIIAKGLEDPSRADV